MKIVLTENQNKRLKTLITESTDDLSEIYKQFIKSVAPLGTYFRLFFSALSKLSDGYEFNVLQNYFLDKKTGYLSFEEMVNGEFDFMDLEKVKMISSHLKRIGIESSYQSEKKFGYPIFKGGFTIEKRYASKVGFCRKNYSGIFTKAKDYWKNWLNNPVTIQKIAKANFSGNIGKAKELVTDYISVLDDAKLYYYADFEDDAYAYINCSQGNWVYINCSLIDDDRYGTLIHELQHLFNCVQPINPQKKLSDAFVGPRTKKFNLNTLEYFLSQYIDKVPAIFGGRNYENNVQLISKLATQLGITFEEAKSVVQEWEEVVKYNRKNDNDEYQCDPNEKMSNLQSVRNLFNIKPGYNITISMIKPYVLRDKSHTDIYWLLSCWAKQGYKDLSQFLSELNSLAKNLPKQDATTGMA